MNMVKVRLLKIRSKIPYAAMKTIILFFSWGGSKFQSLEPSVIDLISLFSYKNYLRLKFKIELTILNFFSRFLNTSSSLPYNNDVKAALYSYSYCLYGILISSNGYFNMFFSNYSPSQ